ncbi:probable disease resistance protein At1g61300 isoform X1 [Olea europaea var. sylvestris]|uniref:probable disease resistance protein At1g61300 isoform X1 n=1 Tax=Olea europaea var. sylvestris TaxID=158386 RepID=UPI000C1D27BB|nr:probable disease resistance protein At1g61300 isoform X1 [Olea europaea var. sylvestris]XP_022893221.1 probable disease resistance protein At1g61300 isoform X1 [Olea europaea var. sylvestris]XP_022893222.1 probable disease resistance protein At1g61300 isoform X1 [Olea europaea var. sylvestris]XP_022893223.1 probable disease resistance protein At1g61300 isoform X1 [Olea europaea var. sylvestris]
MGDMLANIAVNAASDYYNLETKMQNLKRKLELLNCQEADVVARLGEEECLPGKRRKHVVQYWLSEVVSKQKEFESLEADVNQNRRAWRVSLAKRADKMFEEVTILTDQGAFSEGVVLAVSETIKEKFVTAEWKGQGFKEKFHGVWTYLLGNGVSSIGIYGMGGVGKTTLAQCIYNELKNENLFYGNIFWFTVSQDLNIYKLQNDIGKALNLDLFDEDDEHKRAAKLGWALERRKKFVLILDDVWNSFPYQKIGISPSHAEYEFKMIVISRSLEVCLKMECQECLKVDILSDEEAWELFMNKHSNGKELPPKVKEIAREVVKECAGLPLAIVTMAGSLRGVVDIREWRDALEELKESCVGQDDMENKVFPILLWSFNRLRDPILKSCFLYCSLYPEDFHINRYELIQNFISEEMMERRTSRQAYFDQGHKILNKLVNVCLLETWGGEHVKMHDLIRDMALKITKDKWMVKAGLQLKEIPKEQEWKEDLDKVSLMRNNINNIWSVASPKCPKLSTLLLNFCPLKSIPDSFFLHMRGLHVLNLSNTLIEYLPNSISGLEELNALLLGGCQRLKFVPPLENLKALKELDLSYTGIKEIPRGVESLTNLKCLDTIRSCIRKIPTGILQGLSLQRLSLPTRMRIPIDEVAGLKQLEEFYGKFHSMHDFNIFIKSRPSDGKLNFFHILVGKDIIYEKKLFFQRFEVKRVTFGKDSLKKGKRGKDEIMLPRNVDFLMFDRCGLCSCLFDDIQGLNSATELKTCSVYEEGIVCILRMSLEMEQPMVEEEQQSSLMPLYYLEDLNLQKLPNFIGLIRWEVAPAVAPLPRGLFSHLRKLLVVQCGKIKKLLPRSLVQNLHNLNELIVGSCAKLEEIIGDEESDGGFSAESNTVITLPRLKILDLRDLPELEIIYKGTIICDSIKKIHMERITKVRKVPFSLPPLAVTAMKEDEGGWWDSLEWEQPNANRVL